MKLKIGDRVKFLNDAGGGIVVSIVDAKRVMVRTEGDWDIPYAADQLVRIDADDAFGTDLRQRKPGNEQQNISMPKPIKKRDEDEELPEATDIVYIPELGDDLNIYFGFVPSNPANPLQSNIEFFLINDSNYHLYYNIAVLGERGMYNTLKHGRILANTKLRMETIERNKLNDRELIVFQYIAYRDSPADLKMPLQKEIRLQTAKLYKATTFTENDFFDNDAYIVAVMNENLLEQEIKKLTQIDIQTAARSKEQKNMDKSLIAKFRREQQDTERVIDLHIHELLDDYRNLTPKEIIDLQMDTFRRQLNDAIAKQVKRIVFIHGVGNGTLKLELRRELDRAYKQYRYQDASFREYGFGATLVLLKN